jgi:pseudouridine-5'-phosphate glycosidase
MTDRMDLSAEVSRALQAGRPVLALESTIIAHGLPKPVNVETACVAEDLARSLGVAPATVAVIDGRLKVGLSEEEIAILGRGEGILKLSSRDLGYAVSRRMSGATTVSATMRAARLAGIQVFATGGIGGVHRDASLSFDVSTDLTELGRTPVIVVSAGAKAVLNLPGTLEVLETLGVPVIGYRTGEFPSFYSRTSGLPLSQRAETPGEIASIFLAQGRLGIGMECGLLVANPVPAADELPAELVEGWLAAALKEQKSKGISGKAVTPFLLARLAELSAGRTLKTNVALYKNNVRLGCRIAAALAEARRNESGPHTRLA